MIFDFQDSHSYLSHQQASTVPSLKELLINFYIRGVKQTTYYLLNTICKIMETIILKTTCDYSALLAFC